MKYIITILLITFNFSSFAFANSLKCGESKLYKKYSEYNLWGDRELMVKPIIRDLKTLDVEILGLSELDMEKKLLKIHLDEKAHFKIENQKEYSELVSQFKKLINMKDKQSKDKKASIKKTLKIYRKACLIEKHLLSFLDEARRVMWYKHMCDKNIKNYCRRIERYY